MDLEMKETKIQSLENENAAFRQKNMSNNPFEFNLCCFEEVRNVQGIVFDDNRVQLNGIKKFQWSKVIVSNLLIFIDSTGRATWLYFKNIFHGDAAEEKYNALKPVLDEFIVEKTACIVNHGVTG